MTKKDLEELEELRRVHEKAAEIFMRLRPDVPVLDAYAFNRQMWAVWCEHCGGYHFHGPTPGHRVAHCSDSDGPYRVKGYVLQYAGRWKDRPFTRDGKPRRRPNPPMVPGPLSTLSRLGEGGWLRGKYRNGPLHYFDLQRDGYYGEVSVCTRAERGAKPEKGESRRKCGNCKRFKYIVDDEPAPV